MRVFKCKKSHWSAATLRHDLSGPGPDLSPRSQQLQPMAAIVLLYDPQNNLFLKGCMFRPEQLSETAWRFHGVPEFLTILQFLE